MKSAINALAISGCVLAASGTYLAPQADAQSAPYLLPYTIQRLASGAGTAPTIGQTCTGTNGVVGTAYDVYGDGCPITSPYVIVGSGSDIHDVGVDSQGNIYIEENLSQGFIRRIDARSGIITAYAGTASSTQPTSACTNSAGTLIVQDKYGDGCQANDGKANATPASGPYIYTTYLAKGRGIAVTPGGDVYFADYNGYTIHKVSLQTGIFSIVAGVVAGGTVAAPKGNIGQKGYTGDGGSALTAEENSARGVTADSYGNVYIADTGNNVIRMVFAGGAAATRLVVASGYATPVVGNIYTIVGKYPGANTNATAGATGDGGPAPAALISAPEDVEVDAFGNVYIADFGNSKIRVVYEGGTAAANIIAKNNPGTTPTVGSIYTIMGGGTATYTPNQFVLGTSVAIGSPRKMYVDARGNVYLADNGNNVIWFMDATTGYMRPIAGTFAKTSGGAGCSAATTTFGDNCPALNATLNPNSAMGVAVDAFGNVYISDSGDKELRKVVTNQEFPVVANGTSVSQILEVHFAAGDGPSATTPYTITGSADFTVTNSACTTNADTTQDCLVTVTFTPTVPGLDTASLIVNSTLNGSSALSLSGTGTAAAIALDPGTTASLTNSVKNPAAIAQDAAGNNYIADTGNNRILEFNAGGTMTVIAGTGTSGYTGDSGLATAATLNAPKAVVPAPNGFIYIADTGNNVIRAINPVTHFITTVGGGATTLCPTAIDAYGDACPATSAKFNAPAGLAADIDSNIFIADTGNNIIRELTYGGYAVYVGGSTAVCGLAGTDTTFGNGCPANGAIFSGPTGLQVDTNRNLYLADTGNNEVRKIGSNNIVTLIAGTGVAAASGNGGPATGAQLNGPTGVAVDAAANIYIADTGNSAIRIVNAAGTINSAVGTLSAPGTGTLPGSAFAVQLTNPTGVVSNGQGTLTVLDSGNNRAFTVGRGSVSYNFGRTLLNASSPTLQIQETSTGSASAVLGSPLFTTTGAPATFTLTATGSTGCSAGETLTSGSSCLLAAQFNPTALGLVTATYTETGINTINSPVPFITLTGTGAVLTKTTSTTVVTTPATGSPQYSVPFVVTTTVAPVSCNTAAPSCFATGTVTFFVDGTQVGLPIALSATDTASQTISGLNVGSHQVIAVYNGDSYYASSTASTLVVTIAKGSTTATVTATPATVAQFKPVSISASIVTAVPNVFPTGTVTFFAGTTQIGTATVTTTTGVATITDNVNSFGLVAGSYAITAVYSGDSNYSGTTSPAFTLVIAPDAPSFTTLLQPAITGTAQGSTAQSLVTITPSNTLSGNMTFACTGMPTDAVCTFSPTTLTFTPVPGSPTAQQVNVTLWTDVPPGVIPTATARNHAPRLYAHRSNESQLAGLLGWPVLLASFFGLVAFRKRLRATRLLTILALFGILTGGSIVLSGCSQSTLTSGLTPPGVYNVQLVITGPNGTSSTQAITFTVTAGVAGQL